MAKVAYAVLACTFLLTGSLPGRAEVVFPNCTTSYGFDGKPIITCTEPFSTKHPISPETTSPEMTSPEMTWGDLLGSSHGWFQNPSSVWGDFGNGHLSWGRPNAGPPPPPPAGPPPPPPPSAPAARHHARALVATRALIVPDEEPPKDVAAYGIVAFTTKPLATETARYTAFCEAYKATLLTQQEAGNTPISQQMITFWPVLKRPTGEADPDCAYMVDTYDLKAGLDAIQDADKQKAYLAQKQGPFLIAWSPSRSRTEPDPVILVVNMSDIESADSFREVLKAWRQKVIDDPAFWRNGFDWEQMRLAFRDLIDHYGDTLLPFLPK